MRVRYLKTSIGTSNPSQTCISSLSTSQDPQTEYQHSIVAYTSSVQYTSIAVLTKFKYMKEIVDYNEDIKALHICGYGNH